MKKQNNWVRELDKVIKSRLNSPFKWGKNDCCLFAADCMFAMTGTDPAKEFRGNYETKKEAYRELRNKYGNIKETMLKKEKDFGWQPVNTPSLGDICLVKEKTLYALGVCSGPKILCVGENGLDKKPLSEAIISWRIG